jgi:hypothetical protein
MLKAVEMALDLSRRTYEPSWSKIRAMRILALLFAASLSLVGQTISTEELERYLKDSKKIFFLDVREPKEIEDLGSVEGYVNIPLGQLESRLNEVPKDKLVITL